MLLTPLPPLRALQAGGVWAFIRTVHRAAHLTITVSPRTAADLVGAGACERTAVKVSGWWAGGAAVALPLVRGPLALAGALCLSGGRFPNLSHGPMPRPRHPLQVWPKAVDCELFHPSRASRDMRRRLEGGGGTEAAAAAAPQGAAGRQGPLLLFVGRVSPEKNLGLLRRVLEQAPGARLAIVGDGPGMAVSGRGWARLRRRAHCPAGAPPCPSSCNTPALSAGHGCTL